MTERMKERVSFRDTPIGPVVRLAAPGGVAEVALLGAQTIGWCPTGFGEILFRPPIPPQGIPAGTEVHGGIPVCWPWFGRMGPPGASPHGLARYQRFTVRSTETTADHTAAVLGLALPSDASPEFPHPFRLVVRIAVGDGLEIGLLATNTGTAPFMLTAGFHPYLQVSSPDMVAVAGLEDAPFIDWQPGSDGCGAHARQVGPYRPAPGSRVFAEPRPVCRLRDPAAGRTIVVGASGHTRWCVWRADERSGPTGNLREGDARAFVCVEPVLFPRCDALELAPGASHSMSLTLRAEAGT